MKRVLDETSECGDNILDFIEISLFFSKDYFQFTPIVLLTSKTQHWKWSIFQSLHGCVNPEQGLGLHACDRRSPSSCSHILRRLSPSQPRHYKVNMLPTDTKNLSISDLGCHGPPEAVSGWGWAARCRGYRPPRGRRPRCSICAAAATTTTSAPVCSGGSVQCTSTEHLETHTHTHFSQVAYFPTRVSDGAGESRSAGEG